MSLLPGWDVRVPEAPKGACHGLKAPLPLIFGYRPSSDMPLRRADFIEEQQEAQQPLGYFAKLEKVRSKR